jgi:hypothetical protein
MYKCRYAESTVSHHPSDRSQVLFDFWQRMHSAYAPDSSTSSKGEIPQAHLNEDIFLLPRQSGCCSSTARLGPHPAGARTLRRLPRLGGTELRHVPPFNSAVQPPDLSYTAHWEVLGCALCLLTNTAIPRTGPVWARGFCPGSRRPRARVPLVVWAWDLFVMRLLCCGLPAPARRQFFALRFVTVCH